MTPFALSLVVATFLYSLFIVIDKLFLRYLSDFTQLGLYMAAFKIASALLVFQTAFSNFWVPTAYKWYQTGKPLIYFKVVSEAIMGLIAFAFVALLLFKGIIVMLLSPDYQATQYIFPFLCFYPLMMTVSETTHLGIVFQKKSYFNIVVSAISLIVAVCLNWLLIPAYGAVGAAIATGTAYIVFFLTRTYFSMRVWEGFSVKRHLIVTLLLYGTALLNVIIRDIFWISIINGLILLLLLLIYFPAIKKGWAYFQNRKEMKP
ncbi:lipopolysaccharide biosynthesis protein [Listeria floridensis]|uniref:lipopolysaccharide biosynthesis protein n=1 Tax=Listeria floridensis TaxID=1494962 RepID=UPI0004AC7D26|nr:polysaccharide biosynthesis C-terminal domain-containing protein [Listeria floridensis]